MQALVHQIAGSDTSVHIQILAHQIAEAQVDLVRVRYARHRLLLEEFSNSDYQSPTMMRKKLTAVVRFARAFGADTPLPADMIEYLDSKPEGPFKNGHDLVGVSSKLSTVMSGAPVRDASLQFERLMKSVVAEWRVV